jgi:hypothetical protein
MATVQLLGRGTYGPRVDPGPGVSPLWSFFLGPPAQNSVMIYDDGTVVERQTFEDSDIKESDVYMFILGGTDFRCDVGSFEYTALTAAGYTWREVVPPDTYSSTYQDAY